MIRAHPNVEFIGEVNETQKADFLGGAAALLFPIDWPEPFGLVMIEAIACGTPVIAYRRGSVPEVIDENVSGFVVDTIDEAIAAVRRIASFDRAAVRAQFELRFSVERMAGNYLDIYRRLLCVRDQPGRPNERQKGLIARQSSQVSSLGIARRNNLAAVHGSSAWSDVDKKRISERLAPRGLTGQTGQTPAQRSSTERGGVSGEVP
jgi:hypothetical protein